MSEEDEPKDLEPGRGMVPAPDSGTDRPRPADGRLGNGAIAGDPTAAEAVVTETSTSTENTSTTTEPESTPRPRSPTGSTTPATPTTPRAARR